MSAWVPIPKIFLGVTHSSSDSQPFFFGDSGENDSVALLGILCTLKFDNYY